MRIDGYSSSYALDRSARQSNAQVYRDAARESQTPANEVEASSARHSTTQIAPVERVQNSAESRHQLFPSYASEPLERYQPALSNRAAQALASYGSTASMVSDLEPMQVLGLDLYA